MKAIHPRRSRHGKLRVFTAAIAACLLLSLLTACRKNQESESDLTAPDSLSYDGMTLNEYIRLGDYTDLEIACEEGETKGDAAFRIATEHAVILKYPEDQVAYYAAQTRAKYRYYAGEHGLTYEEVLKELGINQLTIDADAKEMVKKDLVFRMLVEAEDISLTEQEKEALFPRYVEKYVADYGYTATYVSEHMADLIYESMLFDKVSEFLIVNNHFIEE